MSCRQTKALVRIFCNVFFSSRRSTTEIYHCHDELFKTLVGDCERIFNKCRRPSKSALNFVYNVKIPFLNPRQRASNFKLKLSEREWEKMFYCTHKRATHKSPSFFTFLCRLSSRQTTMEKKQNRKGKNFFGIFLMKKFPF